MSSFKEAMGNAAGPVIQITILLLYLIGMATLISDDHRYTAKEVVVGVLIPPYTIYVGGKASFRFLFYSGEYRERESRCLDDAEEQGIFRKPRLVICECVAEGKSIQQCDLSDLSDTRAIDDSSVVLTTRSSGPINRFAIDVAA